jgi:hypothetical protein
MLSKRALILAKVETSYGSDPTPTPAADSILVFDPVVKVNADKLERPVVRPSLSQIPHLIGKKYVEITFSTELKHSGTVDTPPEVAALLQACGLAETVNATVSVVYDPASSSLASCTIYAYLDGLVHKITGCRGSFEIVGEAGAQPKNNWTFHGIYATPSDAAIPAGAAYDSSKGPVFQNATFSWGGYSAKIQQLSLNLNNDLSQREVVTAAHGVAAIEIVGRTPGGSINPEAVSEATRPFWANWEAGSGATLQLVIGDSGGNIIQIDSDTNGCVKESISWGDRNGVRIYDIPFGLYGSSGDDEIKLTFK